MWAHVASGMLALCGLIPGLPRPLVVIWEILVAGGLLTYVFFWTVGADRGGVEFAIDERGIYLATCLGLDSSRGSRSALLSWARSTVKSRASLSRFCGYTMRPPRTCLQPTPAALAGHGVRNWTAMQQRGRCPGTHHHTSRSSVSMLTIGSRRYHPKIRFNRATHRDRHVGTDWQDHPPTIVGLRHLRPE
jgi:hypothetical protein